MTSKGRTIAACAAALLAAGVASLAAAQDARTDRIGKANDRFGMDERGFRRLFAGGEARKEAPLAAATTPEQLADRVVEIRLFLTENPNVMRGEVVVAGPTRLKELVLQLEGAPVRLVRTGEGVFAGEVSTDAKRSWEEARRDLQAAIASRAGDGRAWVRRGPRDIVPAAEALASMRRVAPDTMRALDAPERVRVLATQDDPLRAARSAGIDIRRTPLFTFPGPLQDPARRARLVFGIPVFDFFPPSPPSPPVPIDDQRSLMVKQVGVVEDPGRTFDACTGAGTPGGAWTFGHLMREMSFGTGVSAEEFVEQWLSTWSLPQEANGWIVDEPGRGAQVQSRIVASWQRLSGATLDVDRFPARLLAIVNRPDLADRIGYGTAGSAGEGRFVFGLLEKDAGGGCNVLPFTVIFEYGIRGGSCMAVKAWHQRWKDLDANAPGSAAYNTALEAITRDFTEHGTNPAQSPNQSSLNQLRTDEIALGSPWQLREFRLQSTGSVPPGLLDLVTVKQSPDDSFRNGTTGTTTVGAFLVAREADILADRHVVPARFPGILDRFLGAKSDNPFPPSDTFWTAPGLATLGLTDAAETRRKFSLGTCNGCHGGETQTFFTHIGSVGNRAAGSEAALSGFLTGIDVTVPVTGGTHHYADLEERKARMSDILGRSCFALLGVRRLPFVH